MKSQNYVVPKLRQVKLQYIELSVMHASKSQCCKEDHYNLMTRVGVRGQNHMSDRSRQSVARCWGVC